MNVFFFLTYLVRWKRHELSLIGGWRIEKHLACEDSLSEAQKSSTALADKAAGEWRNVSAG